MDPSYYAGPVYLRADGSLVVQKHGNPYHIPTDWPEHAYVFALITAGTLPAPIGEPAP